MKGLLQLIKTSRDTSEYHSSKGGKSGLGKKGVRIDVHLEAQDFYPDHSLFSVYNQKSAY